ncbi:error-prone DNA polymerase [Rhodanobacter sp. L36]|uniref:error-prone DNA polymerase n=1 Tax=Rhodanobacter sp. L36 TaxID=1747221 RepID=UPI00131E3853|nr:error-prone DNA polymerase [Rhodanobacter sp. L36]
MTDYAELHCLSDFSFGRGASNARELFERAKACGYSALAITDECSLAGIVRAYQASQDIGLHLIVGAEFQLNDGPKLVLLCENKQGYTELCRLITCGRRASEKGTYRLTCKDLQSGMPGTLALWIPEVQPNIAHGRWMRTTFDNRAWLSVELHRGPDDATRLRELQELGRALDLPLVASGDVHMHVRRRLALQHTLTAIRHRVPIAEAGALIFRNGERHLRRRDVLVDLYPDALLQESVHIAERCMFHMSALKYDYPTELVPEGYSSTSWLRQLAEEGIRWRWPDGVSDKVRKLIDDELALIALKKYEPFFLTVRDIVHFARDEGILCQGRGSAANSAVCFALGVTEVDPEVNNLLVARFISEDRDEPPDIDVDFEHERREEVIQYIYKKYGRERAALAATVICYRGRSAVRDVAKALGLPLDQADQLSDVFARGWGDSTCEQRLREQGFDPDSPIIRRVLKLTFELLGMPRHLSQHVGGFVISNTSLSEMVPVENAAMPDRTVIQWEKDDLDYMRMLKVDCLALGMLTCLRKCFSLLKNEHGVDKTIASIAKNHAGDKDTYAMIRRADTVGVFQIESRAQMAMLPRHRPTNFYDLVIQVAIVRPGPIQGDMVHPYLRRRNGEEEVDYPSPESREVLERTLGVPLFQEQVMKLAMVAAGFSADEADKLRRSMAAWKRHGGLEPHREKLMQGMLDRNYTAEFAARIFEQIKGFGSYGFPESHAASFANLVFASCWLKRHYPAAFACALLNSQPMGFYGPSQIVQDVQRHRIAVRPVDVRFSDWDCTLENDARGHADARAIRLGLRMVRGFPEAAALRLAAARKLKTFIDIADLCARADLDRRQQDLLADAAALRGLAGHRHHARWAVAGVEAQWPLFGIESPAEQAVILPLPTQAEDTLADYARVGVSLGPHPLKQIRARLNAAHCLDGKMLRTQPHNSRVRVAGLVTSRQRPQTASGIIFLTLEDEHGLINVVVWRHVADAQRRPLLQARLLAVEGQWEHVDGVSHLIAHRLKDLTPLLGALDARSRDFH